jgi:hypothetical protein
MWKNYLREKEKEVVNNIKNWNKYISWYLIEQLKIINIKRIF